MGNCHVTCLCVPCFHDKILTSLPLVDAFMMRPTGTAMRLGILFPNLLLPNAKHPLVAKQHTTTTTTTTTHTKQQPTGCVDGEAATGADAPVVPPRRPRPPPHGRRGQEEGHYPTPPRGYPSGTGAAEHDGRAGQRVRGPNDRHHSVCARHCLRRAPVHLFLFPVHGGRNEGRWRCSNITTTSVVVVVVVIVRVVLQRHQYVRGGHGFGPFRGQPDPPHRETGRGV